LKPYVGIRTGWIQQHTDIDYAGGIFFTTILLGGLSLDATDFIKMKNHFWGMGPRIGIAPHIILGKGFSFYGNADISNLLGYFNVKQKENFLYVDRFVYHKDPFRACWIGNLVAGIEWKTFFCDERYALTFNAGWDYYIFFHQMELKTDNFDLVPHNRNLSIQGVVFSGRFDF